MYKQQDGLLSCHEFFNEQSVAILLVSNRKSSSIRTPKLGKYSTIDSYAINDHLKAHDIERRPNDSYFHAKL